jgi:hypothetical protein
MSGDQGSATPVQVTSSSILMALGTQGQIVGVGDAVAAANVAVSGIAACASGSAAGTVTDNPRTQGSASISFTGISLSSCSAGGQPATILVSNLPETWQFFDSPGLPVMVNVDLSVTVPALSLVCGYVGSLQGTFDDSTSTISFTGQSFALTGGSASCGPTANESISFGPVSDSSLPGDPSVFVN